MEDEVELTVENVLAAPGAAMTLMRAMRAQGFQWPPAPVDPPVETP
jgi:hypothetical protein